VTALLPAVEFDAPLQNPSPGGLFPVVTWADNEPLRFLGDGVRIRTHNFGGESASGVWHSSWCADPGTEVKEGTRPDQPAPFQAITAWAFDQCGLSAPSQAEVRERAAHNLRLLAPVAVEREFAGRLLADTTPVPAADVAEAVGALEDALAETNTLGVLHAAPRWASRMPPQLAVRSGSVLRSPGGHVWVFGGGYVQGLDDTLVATSPLFGWRGPAEVRDTIDYQHNLFLAVAEQSFLIGYEQAVAAAVIS
jgi:hypothetical protein